MSDKETAVPRSFRFSDEAVKAIDEGAARFNMSRTEWIEWLAAAAVSTKKKFIATDQYEISVEAKKR